MVTEATEQALVGLRDLTTLQWYWIPLMAIVFYIYTNEIKKARESGDWNAIYAGLTIFALDFFNETWNGWVMVLSDRSAFWTAPGPTALRTMIGWNIEIMFMFSIAGIIFYNTLPKDRKKKMFGIQSQWVIAIGYAAFCVFIEVLLNIGGHLVWEYSFWNRSFKGIWLIFLIGYLYFYIGAIFVINRPSNKQKTLCIIVIYLIPVVMNIIGMGFLGWVY